MKEESHIPHVCVHVIDPHTGYSMDPKQWMARPEDERQKAEWLHFQSSLGYEFNIHKKALPRGKWKNQIESTARLCEGGRPGTRLEWLLVHYAKQQSEVDIDELLEAIGGDPLVGFVWIEEEYQYNATTAWCVHLNYGDVYHRNKTRGYQVRLVSAF